MVAYVRALKMEPFELQPPAWGLIEKCSPPGELDEVKEVIGPSLVDLSVDLYQEAHSLLEIWRSLNEETLTESTLQLPEPPRVREMLEREIAFLVDHVHRKTSAACTGEELYCGTRESEQVGVASHISSVMGYVLRTSQTSSRSSSAGSESRPVSSVSGRDGRATPLCATPTSEGEGSAGSNISDRVEALSQHVNSTDIDTVVQHIRSAFEEECQCRKRDIQFLQSCLEEEQGATAYQRPSLQDLREARRRLEEEVHSCLPPSAPKGKIPPSQKVHGTRSVQPLKAIHSLPHVQCSTRVEEEGCPQDERNSRHAHTRPSTASRFRAMVAETRQV